MIHLHMMLFYLLYERSKCTGTAVGFHTAGLPVVLSGDTGWQAGA